MLAGLGDGVAVADLVSQAEPLHPRYDTFSGEVFLRLAADALAWSVPARVRRRGT